MPLLTELVILVWVGFYKPATPPELGASLQPASQRQRRGMFIASASPQYPRSVGAAQSPVMPALFIPPREASQAIGQIMKSQNNEPAKPENLIA
jgi:hypothetical protein